MNTILQYMVYADDGIQQYMAYADDVALIARNKQFIEEAFGQLKVAFENTGPTINDDKTK